MRYSNTFTSIAVACVVTSCAAPQMQMNVPTASAVDVERDVQKDMLRGGMQVLSRAGERVSEDHEIRTFVIGNRILIAGAELCGEKTRMAFPFGVRAEKQGEFKVLWAVEMPGADQSLKFGDHVKAIDGQPTGEGRSAARALVGQMLTAVKENRTIKVSVEREGAPHDISVAPVKACDYDIEYTRDDEVNAFADGKKMVVNRGLMRKFGDDHEVAFVLGHELAHNALDHIGSKKNNRMIGALLGAVLDVAASADGDDTDGGFTQIGASLGVTQYSQDFEREADYVGTYLVARAGFDVEAAPDAARRLASADSLEKDMANSHPSTPERAAALELTVAEIKGKMASGAALLPERKAEPEKAPKKKK